MSKPYGTRIRIPYLHLRPEGFVWRRRIPKELYTLKGTTKANSQAVAFDFSHDDGSLQRSLLANDKFDCALVNAARRPDPICNAEAAALWAAQSASPNNKTSDLQSQDEALSNHSGTNSNQLEWDSNQHDSNQLMPCVNPENWSAGLIQSKNSVCISLKTKRIECAADLAKQITNLSNLIFLYAKTMTQDPIQIEKLLIELGRFLVESADIARSLSNPRSELAAEISMTSEMAVQEVVMQSFRRRDFSIFLRPLADVAKKLGISLPQEGSADAKILAYEAARITLDASKERMRRDQGIFPEQSPYFIRALAESGQASRRVSYTRFADNAEPREVRPEGRQVADDAFISPEATFPVPAPTRSSGARDNMSAERACPPDTALKPDATSVLRSRNVISYLDEHSIAAIQRGEGMSFQDAAHIYCTLKSAGFGDDWHKHQKPDAAAGRNWVRNSLPAIMTARKIWVDLSKDCPLADIDIEMVDEIISTIRKIPKLHGKGEKFSTKKGYLKLIEKVRSMDQMEREKTEIAMRKEGVSDEAQIAEACLLVTSSPLRVDTFIRNVRAANRVGKMLIELGIIQRNPFQHCTFTNAEEKRMKATEATIARQKWDDRFLELLSTSRFQGETDGQSDPLFWMPLIAYTMGLRSEEAAQLTSDDVSSDQGIHYVQIRQMDGNHVKSAAGVRSVPVHPALIDLGFLLLVDEARKTKAKRLFPSLTRGATKGTFTENFTKLFSYFRRTNDVYWHGLDFHALRTTFHHLLLDNSCPGAHRRRLMGHEPLDEGERSYAQNGISMRTLAEHVSRIPLNVHRIRSPFHEELLSEHRPKRSTGQLRVVRGSQEKLGKSARIAQ